VRNRRRNLASPLGSLVWAKSHLASHFNVRSAREPTRALASRPRARREFARARAWQVLTRKNRRVLSPSLAPDAAEPIERAASSTSTAAALLAADAKDAARSVRRTVQEQTAHLAENVGHELKKTAEDQKARGMQAIQCFARAIGNAADEIENQSPRLAQSVRDAGHKIDGLSKNIRNRDVDELISATSEAARSQPIPFMGGAVTASFALGRFFKSSTSHRTPSEATHEGRGPRLGPEEVVMADTTRPLASLATRVISDIGYLVQTEIRLAQAETLKSSAAPRPAAG
jgi:hypothetical protein